jgi:DNA-binding XRE family transcriptional regulator
MKEVHNNVQDFKKVYKEIVKELIEIRTLAKFSQQFMAEWLKIDRRKIIAFENLKKVDLETMLKYSDKLSVDIKFNYIIKMNTKK